MIMCVYDHVMVWMIMMEMVNVFDHVMVVCVKVAMW